MGIRNFLAEMLMNPYESKDDKKFIEPETTIKTEIELPNSEEVEETSFDADSKFYSIDTDVKFRNIKEAILTYREVATNHEIEAAIDEIEYSSIVDDGTDIVSLDLDEIEDGVLSDNIKNQIIEEFKEIIRLLKFKRRGSGYFRKWYIDGRIWFQVLTGNKNKSIVKIKLLSPLDITRVKKSDGSFVYLYKEDDRNKASRNQFYRNMVVGENSVVENGVEIPEKNIVFVPSGLVDPIDNYYVSYLHNSIKPLNQLKQLEDSAIIYYITRAPEKRAFYINVGKLPKTRAQQYVKSLMDKFKTSVVYDVNTGEVTQRKNSMTMLEDYYIPTRGDDKSTRIESLQGGQLQDKLEIILYFKKKLLKSLKVPFSRIDDDSQSIVDFGRGSELTHAELKFNEFKNKLRIDFSVLFIELLKTQLVLKNILTIKEFNQIKDDINFIWESNSHFSEIKDAELLKERIELADSITSYIGKYFSNKWVKKNVFKLTDDEIDQMDKEIEEEKKSGEIDEMDDEI